MKKLFALHRSSFLVTILSFAILFLFSINTWSQTPQYYNSNTGTSANSFPFNTSGGKAVNSMILAGEFSNPTPLPSGMQITTVYFRTGTTGTRAYTNLIILMAQDVITTLTSGTFYAGPYDTVFVKDTSLTSTSGGWMQVILRHPFVYDPTKSLILFVGQCGFTGTGTTVYNTTFTGVRRVWSVGGCPFVAYASGDASTVNFGVDVVPAASVPSAPVLVSPTNNATNIPISLTCVWNKPSTSITNYWWEMTTDTVGMTNLQRDTTLTDTTKSVSGLSYLTSYYWRVKAKNSIGWGNFSGWFKFTTVPPLPAAPTLISPANNSINIGLYPLLDWSVATYSTSYKLQLSTDSTFATTILDSTITQDSLQIISAILTNNTKYYWHVRGINITGNGPYSTTFSFTTIPGIPGAPILIAPASGATNVSLLPLFDWSDVTGAIKYWLQISTDSTFTTIAYSDSTLTTSQYQATTNFSCATKYYWRVKAKNVAGWGSWSTIFNFTTIPCLPSAPTLIAPPNNALNQTLTPLLDWSVVATATSYKVQLSADSTFTTTILDSTTTFDSLRVPTGKLSLGIKYYWHVRAINIAGNGPYSVTFNFTTSVTGIVENGEIPKEYKLYYNYPNPFNPVTKIRFDIPKNGNVELKVYDILGKEVVKILNNEFQAGSYTVEFNASALSSGTYFYIMKSRDFTDTKRMLLIK
jgi:hypothetical protein